MKRNITLHFDTNGNLTDKSFYQYSVKTDRESSLLAYISSDLWDFLATLDRIHHSYELTDIDSENLYIDPLLTCDKTLLSIHEFADEIVYGVL